MMCGVIAGRSESRISEAGFSLPLPGSRVLTLRTEGVAGRSAPLEGVGLDRGLDRRGRLSPPVFHLPELCSGMGDLGLSVSVLLCFLDNDAF